MNRLAASLVLVIAVVGCAPLPPDEVSDESRQVQEIVRNTASPFCPGKTLDSCPSPRAAEWRRDVHEWVEEGVPEPEIRERLQARVPGFELSIPPVKWGWLIPVLALALSTSWFIVMARRFRSRGRSPQPSPEPDQQDALDARLDQELAQLE
ncbi:MAG: cytochrome c-type biogenesis protein CcmH [Myxococcales bacterium]|jgi:cytochrome c-type biogenesis protein CcmH/NrfF